MHGGTHRQLWTYNLTYQWKSCLEDVKSASKGSTSQRCECGFVITQVTPWEGTAGARNKQTLIVKHKFNGSCTNKHTVGHAVSLVTNPETQRTSHTPPADFPVRPPCAACEGIIIHFGLDSGTAAACVTYAAVYSEWCLEPSCDGFCYDQMSLDGCVMQQSCWHCCCIQTCLRGLAWTSPSARICWHPWAASPLVCAMWKSPSLSHLNLQSPKKNQGPLKM